MDKTIVSLEQDLSGIRTGRASPGLIEPIIVEAYGDKMPMGQLSTISVLDSKTISIQVWDTSVVKNVEKSITNANLGVNPVTEGQSIRITLPGLTEERRKEFAKMATKYGESSKIAIRNIRRDFMDYFKKIEKSKEISEDELKKMSEEIQKITDIKIKEIDIKVVAKEKEVKQI